MAGIKIKTITRAELCALLPEEIEILQSVKPNARWPLYIKTPWGSWFFNSANAQNRLQMLAQWTAPITNIAGIETIKIEPAANDPATIIPTDKPNEQENDESWGALLKLLKGEDNE